MEFKEFKIIANKQRPEYCYEYVKYDSEKTRKFSIFTMNGGKTFLASITSKNNLGKLVDTDYSEPFDNLQSALDGINKFIGVQQ